MGVRERITGALGGALGSGLGIVTDVLKAANGRRAPGEAQAGAEIDRNPDALGVQPGAMTLAENPAPFPIEPATDDPKGLLYDPFALIDQLGYRDRPSGLTYQTLRTMAKRVPTVTAINQIRINQVASFAQLQEDKREPGFIFELRDPKGTPTDEDRGRMNFLTDWMLQTGSAWGPGRDNFRTFLKKLTRDALELDQATFEICSNRKGDPAEFYALDAATIRLADVPPGADSQHPDDVRYVQVYDEVIIAEFSPLEMCFGVRNPRSDLRVNGYGYSELEMLINVITATLWGFEHNKNFFSQGSAAKGILNFKGGVPDAKMTAFRRQWQMMLSGVSNSHRTPMTNVDELQWIDLHSNNRDMEFSAWMDWLIKITCAVNLMDPAELNFSYGNTGQGSAMFASPVDKKLTQSKDRGLAPLLTEIANWINANLVWRLDPRYRFTFAGMEAKSADQAVDLGKKQVSYLKTVDELRAEDDLDPLPEGKGEVILDPTWIQFAQGKDAGGMDGGMGGDGQDDGQDDGADDEYDLGQLMGDDGEADMAASMRAPDDLRKARVKVYEIEL